MKMFCYQCEQTSNGRGCVDIGVCGKSPETSALQDLLVHATKGISMYASRAADLGYRDPKIDRFVIQALFATVTICTTTKHAAGWRPWISSGEPVGVPPAKPGRFS